MVQGGRLVHTVRSGLLWAPAGGRLLCIEETLVGQEQRAVTAERSLVVIEPDSGELLRIGEDDAPIDPTWSPDGRHIAYIAEDPTTPNRGDLVLADLGGIEPRPLTRGGGYSMPLWLQEPTGDCFLLLRAEGRGAAATISLCLLRPGENDPAKAVTPLATWPAVGQGLNDLSCSPDGALVFVTAWQRREDGTRALSLGILRLRTETGWATGPVTPEFHPLPAGASQIAAAGWSPDGSKMALLARGDSEVDWYPCVLDGRTGEVRRVPTPREPGAYLRLVWADGGDGLLALYMPGPGENRPPQLRILPLDGGAPVPIDPEWGPGLTLDLDLELAGDPSCTLYAAASGNDVRLVKLGTREEARDRIIRGNLVYLGLKLLTWAQREQWAERNAAGAVPSLLPDPKSEACRKTLPGAAWKTDAFWIDLIRPLARGDFPQGAFPAAFEEKLWSPGDAPKGGRRSSYLMPEGAHAMDVSLGSRAPAGSVVLQERTDIRPEGYYVLRWDPRAPGGPLVPEWIAAGQAPEGAPQ